MPSKYNLDQGPVIVGGGFKGRQENRKKRVKAEVEVAKIQAAAAAERRKKPSKAVDLFKVLTERG